MSVRALQLVSTLAAAVAAFGLSGAQAGPTASFTMTPNGNPVVGQAVQFSDASSGSPTSWSWSFGDSQSSTQQSPTHVYQSAGQFPVTLTASNAIGSSQLMQPLIVSTNDTLRLNASHPFTVTLSASDQHHGGVEGPGLAIPQNDLFGYFSLPSLTSNPDNPEVFVKILDGTSINGQYWVFYGHLTDLIYDLTVTEVSTGHVKTYHKDAGAQAPGDADTSGFAATATPHLATPTPTPPPGGKQTITIDVHAWDFNPGGPVSSPLVLTVGTTYKLVFHNVDGPQVENARHGFTGIPELGLPSTDNIARGGPNFVIDNVTLQPFQRGFYPFSCTNNDCGGDPQQHAGMIGILIVQ